MICLCLMLYSVLLLKKFSVMINGIYIYKEVLLYDVSPHFFFRFTLSLLAIPFPWKNVVGCD